MNCGLLGLANPRFVGTGAHIQTGWIYVKVERSAVSLVSCFLQKFLVFALVFLFFALVSCFVHLFLGDDHMSKHLSNSTEKLVIREGIFCVPVRLQIPAV